jgi:hypothetical protein
MSTSSPQAVCTYFASTLQSKPVLSEIKRNKTKAFRHPRFKKCIFQKKKKNQPTPTESVAIQANNYN